MDAFRPLIDAAAVKFEKTENAYFRSTIIDRIRLKIGLSTAIDDQLDPFIKITIQKIMASQDPGFIVSIVKLVISERALNPTTAPRFAELSKLAAQKLSEMVKARFENADIAEILNTIIVNINPETIDFLVLFKGTVAKLFAKVHDLKPTLMFDILDKLISHIDVNPQVDEQLHDLLPMAAEKLREMLTPENVINVLDELVSRIGVKPQVDEQLHDVLSIAAESLETHKLTVEDVKNIISKLLNRIRTNPEALKQLDQLVKIAANTLRDSYVNSNADFCYY